MDDKVYSFQSGTICHYGVSASDIVELLGDSEAKRVIQQKIVTELKRLSHTELSQYDWMYVREYRMAETATPMPVPENIATHYEAVRQWVDQQELLLASMTIEQLEAHEFIVPSL